MTDKEDHVIISDGHYCPLRAELTEDEAPALTQGLKTEPPLPSHTSPSPDPFSDPAQDSEREQESALANGGPPASGSDPSAESKEGGVSGVKSSPYPDEQAVKEYLKKLTEAEQVAKVTAGGELDCREKRTSVLA